MSNNSKRAKRRRKQKKDKAGWQREKRADRYGRSKVADCVGLGKICRDCKLPTNHFVRKRPGKPGKCWYRCWDKCPDCGKVYFSPEDMVEPEKWTKPEPSPMTVLEIRDLRAGE